MQTGELSDSLSVGLQFAGVAGGETGLFGSEGPPGFAGGLPGVVGGLAGFPAGGLAWGGVPGLSGGGGVPAGVRFKMAASTLHA